MSVCDYFSYNLSESNSVSNCDLYSFIETRLRGLVTSNKSAPV